MKIEDYVKEDWVNITPYLVPFMYNIKDGIDWQVDLTLKSSTDPEDKMVMMTAAWMTGSGIILNPNFTFDLRIVKTKFDSGPWDIPEEGFMILARRKK